MSGKVLAALAFVCWAFSALAEGLGEAQYLAFECNSCHLIGQDNGAVPAITGKPAADLSAALMAYRDKERSNVLMQVVAGRLDDVQIEALAAYLQTVQP